MSLLTRVTKESAENAEISKVFELMENQLGVVPDVLTMLANSPGLFQQQMGQIGYYRSHENLGPELLTLIRYTAACLYENQACIDFNGMLLKKQGMSDDELAAVVEKPASAPLEERERALLSFVVDGVKNENSASQEKMDRLLALGWQISDIVDAVYYGYSMYVPGNVWKLFRMME